MEEYYSATMEYFLGVADDLNYDFNISIDVYNNLEIFMSMANCLTFQLDSLLKNYILKHNDELVRNPELREKYKQEDLFLQKESFRTLQKLTLLREKLAKEHDQALISYKKYEHKFQEERRKRAEEWVEDAESSMVFFEVFFVTYLAFYHFLNAIAYGRDIRTCMEEDFMMNKLVYTDLKTLFHDML